MKLLNIFIALCFWFVFSVSCKKNVNSQTDIATNTIPYDTIFRKTATIEYIEGVSIPALWEDNRPMEEATIMHTACTNKGDIFVMVEVEKRYSFEYIYVYGLNAEGESLGETKVKEPQNTKYQFFDSFIIPQKSGFPIYYILAENSTKGVYTPDGNKDPEKALQSLERYSLEQLIFGNNIVNYQVHSVSLNNILRDFVISNQISKFGRIKFRRINDKIFLFGDACTIHDNWSGYPFIISLSDDLKILNSNIYNQDKYMYTEIENINIDKDGRITLQGTKSDGIDGWYYSTHMKFIVDQKLDLLEDMSDSKPYYSFYRGPSAPDYEADYDETEEIAEEDSEEQDATTEVEPELSVSVESNETKDLFYDKDSHSKTFYSLAYDKEEIRDVVLRKINKSDSTILLERIFLLSNKYYPLTLYQTPDGGFIAAFAQRDKLKSGESYQKDYYKSKAILLRFNKQGNLSHQYETPFLTGSACELSLHNVKDKLIAVYKTINSYFNGSDWYYPSQLSVVAFPYE